MTTELQLNHINCDSTDSDSDIENTLLVNTIEVENDYESVTYELDYHTRPRNKNIPIEQKKKRSNNITTT